MLFAIAAALLYMLMFKNWDDFLECIKFWLMPDIISMFRGKYWEDAWAELKLLLWLGIGSRLDIGRHSRYSKDIGFTNLACGYCF